MKGLKQTKRISEQAAEGLSRRGCLISPFSFWGPAGEDGVAGLTDTQALAPTLSQEGEGVSDRLDVLLQVKL